MEFRLDQNSPVPLHAQIESYLRKLINSKTYKTGENLLPKEMALSKKLGVSRNTVRQAVNTLVNEGLIERKKGVGTKVVHKKINTRLDHWISFSKEMQNQGIEVVNYISRISLVKVPSKVAIALAIDTEKEVWKLEKIRGSKDAKYLYSESYFHPRVGIKGKENFNTPLYELLEREHDIVVANSKETLSAVMANPQICSLLAINKDMPLLKRERLVCDPGDRPVEYNVVYYRTDYFTYNIEIKREP